MQATRILSFNEHRVWASQKVVDFYAGIEAEQNKAIGDERDAHQPNGAAPSGEGGRVIDLTEDGGAAAAAAPRVMSDEQRRRMEESKARAMARRQMAMQTQR